VMRVLAKRFGRFGLRLHPDKTRLVDFRHPRFPERGNGRRPETFDLLGFTHYWARGWKKGWVIRQQTSRKRRARAMRRLHEWCRNNRHRPLAVQHEILTKKLRGHDAYYGITGNGLMLSWLRHEVKRVWKYWLDRRSQRARMTWERFQRLLRRFPLPEPKVVHSVYRAAKP